ncbi:MAG TPA: hypothetical protein VE604_13975 [Candidatus Polarisedimenticolia bacterium]|jgi:hypothetical protein|nr:hypothetical protein [Candidatus Polarisedimenticolia bacterium]
MTTRKLCQGLCFTWFLFTISLFAQSGRPVQLGPLNVTVPQGWTVKSDATPVRIYSPDSSLADYFAVDFPAPETTNLDVRERHSQIWKNLSGLVKPGTTPQSGVTGPFIWTKGELMRPGGSKSEIMVLYSAKSGSNYIAVFVDATRPDLAAKNLPALDTMLKGATPAGGLPSDASGAASPANPGNTSGAGHYQSNATGMATLNEYAFTVPPTWTATKYTDGLVLMSPASVTNERCVVTISPMRPSSGGNLLAEADSVFRDVYRQYDLRNMTTRGSPMPNSIVHGVSGQGWEYVIIRRGVAPRGSPESRLGFVFVAKLESRLAVISGVSKDPLVSTCLGELAHNAWPRFFYSLSFKNWSAPDQTANVRKRLAGVWTSATGVAADQITIAGNGRFANAAARQQYDLISSNEALVTTTAAFGNGSYTLQGNAITMIQDDRQNQPTTGFIRMEEESKDEGRTWAPILYLLRVSTVDGQDYEVRYQRTR